MTAQYEENSIWFKSLNEEQQKEVRSLVLENENTFIEKFFKDRVVYDTLNHNNLSVDNIYHDTIKYPTGVWVTNSNNDVIDVRTDQNNNASLFIKTIMEINKLANLEIKNLEKKNLSQLLHESQDGVREIYLTGNVPPKQQQGEKVKNVYENLIKEFNLDHLPTEDQSELLHELANTIQKQFLLDVYDNIGEEKFKALETSLEMGAEFYNTTLKHLVPTYDEIFKEARGKVVGAFKAEK